MRKFIEILKDSFVEIAGSSAYSNERDRPYDGQPQTANGLRGRELISGLTFRDVKDCFINGALLSCGGIDGCENLYERAETNTWIEDDLYKIPFEKIDPLAMWQNMACEMEKMMGIYPNVPRLQCD